MTSLTDVYEGRTAASSRRQSLGTALFVLGAGLVVAGIVVATTSLAESLGLGMFGSRKVAGALAGLGIPVALLGAFAVMPAGRATRAAAVVGASVAVFGVALFWHAYPYEWIGAAGAGPELTLATTVVYFFGTITTAWCLFVGVATFQTRKDPGGSARMEVTEQGRIRLVEEVASTRGLGGIGFFGSDPDGDVETQTNRERDSATSAEPEPPSQPASESATPSQPASDGGAAAGTSVDSPEPEDDAFLDAVTVRGQPDQYCGNCEHFSYVRTDEGIAPYCGLDQQYMDDMDACEDWRSNV
jgi:hypothetical protein